MLIIGVLVLVGILRGDIYRAIARGKDTGCSVGLINFAFAMAIILSIVPFIFWCGVFVLKTLATFFDNPVHTQGSTMEEGRTKEKEQGSSTAEATV